jgi:hypothetical protein
MASNGQKFILSLVKIGRQFQKLKGGTMTHGQHVVLINLFYF